MPEPVSKAARKHLRRGDERTRPAPAAAPTPTPAPAPTAPPAPVPAPWKALGGAFKATTDRLYKAVKVEPPPLVAWEGFAEAWGAVADYYMPFWATTPLPKAIMATMIVAAPLLEAYHHRQVELARKAAEKAAAEQLEARPAA